MASSPIEAAQQNPREQAVPASITTVLSLFLSLSARRSMAPGRPWMAPAAPLGAEITLCHAAVGTHVAHAAGTYNMLPTTYLEQYVRRADVGFYLYGRIGVRMGVPWENLSA